ncbi:MAG: endonuclease/exonuclease/phosphatase family protein [Bacteriovoracaceae bacterium]
MKIKVLSFNIHKGFNWNNQKFTLHELKVFLKVINPDVVMLQEIVGENTKHRSKYKEYPLSTQFEFLADTLWPHFSYGQNAVYDHGNHGNAILCRYPIKYSHNVNLTLHSLEQRGLLHCVADINDQPVNFLCTHLNLFHYHRVRQYRLVADYIKRLDHEAVILGGDFNDWNKHASTYFELELGMKEVFKVKTGHYAQTFPCALPFLTLDRMYTKNISIGNTQLYEGCCELSDHLPISCEFSL